MSEAPDDAARSGPIVIRTRPWSEFLVSLAIFDVGAVGLQCFAFLVISSGSEDRLADWWWMVLLFALIPAVSAAGGQWIASRNRGVRGVLDARQGTHVTCTSSVPDVLAAIRDALRVVGAKETSCTGVTHPVLIARKGAWFGSSLRFALHPDLDGTVEVHIDLEPRNRLAFVDGGHGLAELERVVNAFRWREVRHRLAS